jgi:hypothetical protein
MLEFQATRVGTCDEDQSGTSATTSSTTTTTQQQQQKEASVIYKSELEYSMLAMDIACLLEDEGRQ